jgi:enoyl-CoA hydratase/carnithine racemase
MTTVDPPAKPAQIRLTRQSPAYWRVTIDNPPINVMGPEMLLQFQEVINALEADEHVRVVVFDSAVDDYFLNHSDFLAKLEDLTALPAGPTSLPPWPDFLVRLTHVPVVSIALIRGRATGVSPAAKRPSSRNGRWAWGWSPAVAPWPGCPNSLAETAPWRCS